MGLPAQVDNDNGVELAQFDFDAAVQRKIAVNFMRNTSFALKTKDILRPEYFQEAALGKAVEIIKKHVDVYKQVPDKKILISVLKDEIAANRIRPDVKEEVKKIFAEACKTDPANTLYEFRKVRDFAKHQAMQQAIMTSVALLEKGDFAAIEKEIRMALAIGSDDDGEDYDYFKEIVNRTQVREDLKAGKIVKNGISTGYSDIDTNLYHLGWGRKELSVIMGAAKTGKTLALADFTKNASILGHKVFYASCEVSKKIISGRIDASIADIAVRDLHQDPKRVMAAVQAAEAKNGGVFRMRDFASGTLKVSQLARVLENYRSREGIVFDLVTTDYADIMAAEYRSDQFRENLREIYIDLRALAFEYNCAMLTATQTNRDGAKAHTAKATDVGDDWNKVRTADVIIGINATEAEQLAGEARLYWAASRNTESGFQLKIKQDRAKMQFLTHVIGRC